MGFGWPENTFTEKTIRAIEISLIIVTNREYNEKTIAHEGIYILIYAAGHWGVA